MCGIAGIVQVDERPLDVDLLERMTSALAHRGPDGEGYAFFHPNGSEKPVLIPGRLRDSVGRVSRDLGRARLGFGHRRLAIIDLSPLGQQPMASEDGAIWITYNGEVYNAPELRLELQGLGHQFRSVTDTEVVLESYRRWGPDCLRRFNGMFAFALWDEGARRIFCARDRFGIKPFYYRWAGRRWLFASEIKALLEDRDFVRRPNDRAVYEFLSRGRLDFSTETLFDGIRQLGPGQALMLSLDRPKSAAEPVVDAWWRVDTEPSGASYAEAAVQLRELLEDSVRLQLRADVPIGSCLSGGLDSSSIVCLMSRLMPAGAAPVKTFTLSHDDPRDDERAYSRAVVAHTGAVSQEIGPAPDRLLADMAAIHWHQDEPMAGTSVLGQWAVMQAAATAGVKVLLDGQGGDEALLGYPGFYGSYLADLATRGQWMKGRQEWQAWRRVHGGLPSTAVAALVRGLLLDSAANRLRRRVTGESAWLAPAFSKTAASMTDSVRLPHRRGVTALQRHQLRTLSEDLPALLHYEDRNAMAMGIEARVPFLDHRLVQSLVRLPSHYHLGEGRTKRLLREAMRGLLPEAVRLRSDKLGFVTPEAEWLRGPWRPSVQALLHSDRFRSRPYWKADVARSLFDRFCQGRAAIAPTVWRWASMEWWLERMCEGEVPASLQPVGRG